MIDPGRAATVARRFTALVSVTILAAACASPAGSTAPVATSNQPPVELWPRPDDDAMELTRAAGLEPLKMESSEYHVHVHLDVFKDGRPVVVPGGIGINIDDPAVKRFENPAGPGYGGIQSPCNEPCISPLHTHDPDGVIHTESPTTTPTTLGEFLIEWAVTLPADAKVYLDGVEHTGDVAAIELTDMLEIAIVMGTPPSVIPSDFPSGLRL